MTFDMGFEGICTTLRLVKVSPCQPLDDQPSSLVLTFVTTCITKSGSSSFGG